MEMKIPAHIAYPVAILYRQTSFIQILGKNCTVQRGAGSRAVIIIPKNNNNTIFQYRLFRMSIFQEGYKLHYRQMVAQLRINKEM